MAKDEKRLPTTVRAGSPDSVLREVAPPGSEPRALGNGEALRTGVRLADGRFEIVRRLGEGGMGVVYEAFDAERRGRVALKTLNRVDAASIYRLKNEFRALADVSHPNLVRLHELFADERAWFFTMDLVDGQPFDRFVEVERDAGAGAGPGEAPWLGRLREAMTELVAAVSAIHRAGKLHRDLKPGNVMVRSDGRVVVLDFGLAADPELGGIGQTVLDGRLAGTPLYMAPEQAAGREATPASDWYALGVLLFESLTGRVPFDGFVGEVLVAKQTSEAPRVAELAPGVPEDLSTLCNELLARDPLRRPDAEALRRRLGSAPVPSTRFSSAPPAKNPDLEGRDAELAALREAYRASLEGGQPVVLMLEGESGIGKSTLMAAFLDELRHDTPAVVLHGRCYERETMPFKAFDAVVDELSRYLRRLAPEDAAALTPREAWALTRLFPVLGRIRAFAVAPGREGAEPHELRRRGFVALGEVLGRLRDRAPLVLYIDDLHWTDHESVTLLLHLLRQGDAPALLFVGGRRDGKCELLDPLYDRLPSDIRLDFRRLRLGPLAGEVALRIAGSNAPPAIVEEARGNPFLLRELALRGRDRGTGSAGVASGASLTEILLARCRAQPEESQRLLRAVALSGGSVPLEVVRLAAGVEPRALDTLRDGQLVRQGARVGEVECYHDKIREALAASLSNDEARALHRDLARAWEAANRADPEQLSLHYEGAGERQRAAELAAEAAERAREVFGFERVVELLTRALELGSFDLATTQRLRVARADALALSGRSRDAAEACVAAMQGAGALEATDLARRAGGFYLQGGWLEEAIPLVNRGLEPHALKLPLTERGALAALAWERARVRVRGHTPRTGRRDETAVRRFEAAEAIAFALPRQEPLRYAALASHLFRIALDSADAALVAKGLALEAWTQQLLGTPYAELRAFAEKAQIYCDRDGDPRAQFWLALNVGNAELQRHPAAALEHFERANEILVTHPHPSISFLTPIVAWSVLNVQCLRGFFRSSAREVPALLDDVWAGDDRGVAPFLAGGPGAIARVASGDIVSLRADLERARDGWRKDYFTWQDIMLTQGSLALELHAGNAGRARDVVSALEQKLARSLARHAAPVRAYVEYLRVWATLAHVRELAPGSERTRLLDAAATSLEFFRSIGALSAIWSAPLEPAVEVLRGRKDRAVKLLGDVVADRGIAERLPVYAVYARRALGTFTGGSEGEKLVQEADAFLRERGVVDPERFVQSTAPGLSG
ncbi:MAG TPA: protein kinase [Polyangiaceae bacterium]